MTRFPSFWAGPPARRLAQGLAAVGLGGALVLGLAGLLGGSDFHATLETTLAAPPVRVWALLQDVESLPKRRPGVLRVSAVERDAQGPRRWRESLRLGAWLLVETELREPLKRWRIKLVASSLGLRGSWDYLLEELPDQRTRLTLVEQSRLDRFLPRALFTLAGRDARMKFELKSLQRALETAP